MALPAIRSSSAASNTGGSLSVTTPAGLTAGDLLIAWHYADNDGALSSMGAPSGWTLLGSEAGVTGGHPYVKVWTKVATSSDASASSFAFTDSASGIHNSVVILAISAGTYSSSALTTAVSFQNGGTSSSTSHIAPSLTGVVDGLLLTSHGTDSGGTAATYTPPSGMIEWADTNSGSGSYTALEVNALGLSSINATGTRTATCTVSRPWKGSALIVYPASGGGGGGGGSATRVNLSPNPALKVDATGWKAVASTGSSSDPGLSSWTRSTSVDATLPRTTGFEGTEVPVDIIPPRVAVTAGQSYYWAISIKALGSISGADLLVNFYAALSGGSFVANSGASVPLTLSAGQVTRVSLGPYTVPTGAVSGFLKINDLNNPVEVTAYQVELASTYDGTYFDGDSTGASWDGAAGNSTSTLRSVGGGTGGDAITISATFTKTVTAVGPTFSDSVAVGESFAIAAGSPSSGLSQAVQVRDGFLISSLEWDPVRGRNRVSAFTFGPDVVQARVTRRPVGGGAWQLVRGGTVDVVNGKMVRRVDDYEFPSGIDLEYRIEGVTGASGGALVAQTATVRRTSIADSVWLKFISQPSMNCRLDFMGRTDISRGSRTAVFNVQGRSDPVVVSDVHSSRQFTIKAKTETQADADVLDHALSQGLPCYLQVPASINCPSIYAVIGGYSYEAPARKSARNVFTIPLTEVSAPPASIVSPGATWQQLIDLYGTWDAVLASVPTWLSTAD